MKRISFVLTIVTLLVFSACEKNVLDKNPLGEISENQVWEDVSLAKLFVNNIYTQLPGSIYRDADCATELGEQGHNWMVTQPWNTGDISAGYAPFADEWYTCYTQIRNTNTVLANYSTLKGDPNEIDGIKGQALFLRAYYYTELVNLFGGVPLIDKPQTLSDSLFVSRNSYDECVAFIVKDCNDAAALLPEEWDGSNTGRATKGASLALKSRILLSAASALHNSGNNAAKWQAASDAAKAVIDLNVYALYPDYYRLFHVDNNEEVIFDIQYAFPTRSQGAEYWSNPQGIQGAYGASRPTQEMVDYYEMKNGLEITAPGSGYNPQDPYKDRDPRFYASIIYNNSQWRGRTIETFEDGLNGPGQFDQYATGGTMTGYYNRKFINEANPVGGADKSNENRILIRYAEVLLNYAEAQNALGNDGEARSSVNLIRTRAGMPDLPASLSGTALRDRIRVERTVELAFEELHFFDVRRWMTAPALLADPVHKMSITKTGTDQFTFEVKEMEPRSWRSAFYYLPIPQDELNKNPNLQQNPDY